jgi:hypothetical protein
MGLRGPRPDHPSRRKKSARSKLKVLPGGFEPIVITDEMIDLIICTHEAQPVYVGCLRGRCKAKSKADRCPACLAYMNAANRLRELTTTPAWTVSGLADAAEPPPSLRSNPKGQAAWRRAWQLREELIAAAKYKLGEM